MEYKAKAGAHAGVNDKKKIPNKKSYSPNQTIVFAFFLFVSKH